VPSCDAWSSLDGVRRGPETVAEILNEVAAYALSRTEPASTAMSAAYSIFGAGPLSPSDAASRGRGLLRRSVLDNMHQLEKLEAWVFLSLNGLPQPAWLPKVGLAVEFLATGGRVWINGGLILAVLPAPNARWAVIGLPAVAGDMLLRRSRRIVRFWSPDSQMRNYLPCRSRENLQPVHRPSRSPTSSESRHHQRRRIEFDRSGVPPFS
jgi:hypothetical protein